MREQLNIRPGDVAERAKGSKGRMNQALSPMTLRAYQSLVGIDNPVLERIPAVAMKRLRRIRTSSSRSALRAGEGRLIETADVIQSAVSEYLSLTTDDISSVVKAYARDLDRSLAEGQGMISFVSYLAGYCVSRGISSLRYAFRSPGRRPFSRRRLVFVPPHLSFDMADGEIYRYYPQIDLRIEEYKHGWDENGDLYVDDPRIHPSCQITSVDVEKGVFTLTDVVAIYPDDSIVGVDELREGLVDASTTVVEHLQAIAEKDLTDSIKEAIESVRSSLQRVNRKIVDSLQRNADSIGRVLKVYAVGEADHREGLKALKALGLSHRISLRLLKWARREYRSIWDELLISYRGFILHQAPRMVR